MPAEPLPADSPFHKGELEVQERLGVRDKIADFAAQVVRDHMPDQHRAFFENLPFVLLGTIDGEGRPWASLVAGRPGFMSSPDPRSLNLAGRPLHGDPLNETLEPGTPVGILGIDLEARRRNRMNGTVTAAGRDGLSIEVGQSFGNCPQYIQTRAVTPLPEIDAPPQKRQVKRSDRFDARTRALIDGADTLFIATAYVEDREAVTQGADVSHRGGKPGFVRLEDERTFSFPDFSGNNHFNTIGNIVLNPKAGFLFADFDNGDLVYMTGEAEIVWESAEVSAFAGAQRLIRFRAAEVIRVENSLPLRFDFGDYSPVLDGTGSWADATAKVTADKERNTYLSYEVFDIQPESDVITSFYLRRADGGAVAPHEPGQFLPVRLQLPGEDAPATRTYTVSDMPNAQTYRLSVKREKGQALVSNYLHDHVKPGHRLEAMAPRGKFTLDGASDRPVVLLSAGVGITPMIAMANHIIAEGDRTGHYRRTHFVHGAQNGRVHAFANHIRDLAASHESLSAHFRYSHPVDSDALGITHHSEGHVDIDLLKSLLPFDDHDFYMCGPPPFMSSLYESLVGLGVRDERIHYESFGPATVLKSTAAPAPDVPEADPVKVRFAESTLEAEWSPGAGTLLELAEAAGLSPEFSCRSGICGTCATRITCGGVDYVEQPSAPHGDDEVLICCATPRAGAGEDSCGEDHGVVLAL